MKGFIILVILSFIAGAYFRHYSIERERGRFFNEERKIYNYQELEGINFIIDNKLYEKKENE